MQKTFSLSDSERRAWLRLIRSAHVGPVTFYQLLALHGTASKALAELPRMAARGGSRRTLAPFPADTAQAELDACHAQGVRVIAWSEPDYPALLRTLPDAPPLLYVQGHTHLWQRPVVAMVGARNASAAGRNLASQWAAALGKAGVTVLSGLARGIDTAAHQGSLPHGTVAVVAGGVQHIYPPENRDLTAAIAAQGAVVSENGLSMVPQAAHFPRRNRIISGMAQAVLVVEANMKSGSLITARLAGEQGREVLAVPGSPLDPRCAGTNHLLKEGATLAGSVDDILAVLHAAPPQLSESTSRSLAPLPVTEQDTERWRPVLLELLSPVPVPLDELLRQSGAGLPVVQTILLELQLAGRLEWHRGNKVSLLAVIH